MSSSVPAKKVSADVLRSPRLKIERADKHIHEILSASQAMPDAWFDFSVKRRRAFSAYASMFTPIMKPPSFELTYTPLKPIPEFFALMIGDAIHNLRSALDHLASGIIRTHKPNVNPYFPISKNRDDLINRRDMAAHLANLEAALPGSERLILDKIRPVNGAQDRLWSFHALNNDDKHNLITPTVSVANICGINAHIGGVHLENVGVGNNAAKPFIAIKADTPFTLQGNPMATVDVAFGAGTPFPGEPVIPTLLEIRNLVSETIDAFEGIIRA